MVRDLRVEWEGDARRAQGASYGSAKSAPVNTSRDTLRAENRMIVLGRLPGMTSR